MPKLWAGLLLLFLVLACMIATIPDLLAGIERWQDGARRARASAMECQEGDTVVCSRQLEDDCVAWRVCIPTVPGFGQ